MCPNGASTCPSFYNPALLPNGYNSVSYCALVPSGIGFGVPATTRTIQLDEREQRAFLKAAQKVESYVTDDVTVVVEAYKVAYLDNNGNNIVDDIFGGNEYWNPVCGADALLPPFSTKQPTIVQNPDGSFGYANFPETYTEVLESLKAKNRSNLSPMTLIDYLPSQSEINVEWPEQFFAWQAPTDLATDQVSNFLVGPSGYYPVTAGAKPFTLCASPAAMKMLGFAPAFQKNGHTIDDINSPQNNMNVTLPGTDGAVVIADFTVIPPMSALPYLWMYDSTDPGIVATQLPKAFFTKSLNNALPQLSCNDPAQCQFPEGFNAGFDLIGLFNHEINHVLGLMQSQYYKVGGEGTTLAYTYGTALFPLDLFDLDSDYVVPGYGHSGIHSDSDFTLVPRNNNTYEPTTVTSASTAAQLTPWVQFGLHDHVMVNRVKDDTPSYFPLMNESLFNPDGDIQQQFGFVNQSQTEISFVLVDPKLVNVAPLDVLHFNVQSGSEFIANIVVDTIREYSELAAEGWNIDYSTLSDPYHTLSPLAKWYQTCFDANGVFTTARNKNCKFSVTSQDLQFLY